MRPYWWKEAIFKLESSRRYVGPAGEGKNQDGGRGQRLQLHKSGQPARLRVRMVLGLGKKNSRKAEGGIPDPDLKVRKGWWSHDQAEPF